jgi:hypothetical protein
MSQYEKVELADVMPGDGVVIALDTELRRRFAEARARRDVGRIHERLWLSVRYKSMIIAEME